MFDWFSKSKYPEVSEPSNVLKFPEIKPPLELVKPQSQESYRIGYDEVAEMVTITVLTSGYGSVTMRMNYPAAQQFIKMINTAFPEYDPELDESVK
jgi:hypothetical protein